MSNSNPASFAAQTPPTVDEKSASAATADRPAVRLRSGKIREQHLDRLALVYVRQSSPQQVVDHQESRARQYALADHALTLGWPREQVVVIDEDQGHSGRSADQRTGFQRLLTEVTTDRVGLVLGLEMSRLARSSKDWHNLLELCALFGTLLADQDGIYNPNDTNDRLLLGLKGTMSEYELFTMRNRLQRGLLHKAERGELFIAVPLGYLKLPSGQVVMEPDEQARAVVQLIFDKYDELGTVHGVFRYLLRHDIRVGRRVQRGPQRGQLEWCRPSVHTVADMLHHPLYAGAYAFGRRPRKPKRTAAGGCSTQQRVPMTEWKVLLRDRVPAYVSWERYLANRERLRQNRFLPSSRGNARQGTALLAGLVICGNCGCRLQVRYHRSGAHYHCTRHYHRGTEQQCSGLKAAAIDALVSQQVLRALEPAALELSLHAQTDMQRERERLHQHWKQQLERVRFEAQRAERQYQAVEPENRLVARSLEQQWEEALRKQRQLEGDYQRSLDAKPSHLSAAERARVTALSADLPALWQTPETTAVDRKEIIRCVVDRVVVQVRRDSEHVEATIYWQGGVTSQHAAVRPVHLYEHLRDYDQLMKRVMALREQGHTPAAIAAQLHQEGFAPPTRRGPFNAALVRRLLARHGLTNEKNAAQTLGRHEWWLAALADTLRVAPGKLREWIARGWLHSRKTPAQGLLIVWADRDELRRLRQLRERSKRGVVAHPSTLTTPKEKGTAD